MTKLQGKENQFSRYHLDERLKLDRSFFKLLNLQLNKFQFFL